MSLRALPLSLLGLAVGWGAGRWGAPHLLAALSASSLSRTNYRKRPITESRNKVTASPFIQVRYQKGREVLGPGQTR